MIGFLADADHFIGMEQYDLVRCQGQLLPALSEDDAAFTDACHAERLALMPNPTVVMDLTGGRLPRLVRPEQCTDVVAEFTRARTR